MALWPGQQSGNFILNDWLIGFGLRRFIIFSSFWELLVLRKKIEKKLKKMKKLKKTKKNGRSDCRLCRITSLVPNMCLNFAKRIAFTRCLFTMSPWTVSELLGSRQSKTTKPSFSPSPYINPPPFFPPAPCLRSLYSAWEGQLVTIIGRWCSTRYDVGW